MIPRRRFLTLSAAALALPAQAAPPLRWQGVAMGAEVSVTLHAPPDQARVAMQKVRQILREIEALFSLYDPASELSQLNARGVLDMPDPRFGDLLDHVDTLHRATQGAFDPTVQPLWQAIARGEDQNTARRLIGWDRVAWSRDRVLLGHGQALTLNGIAQGYGTDLLRSALRELGLTRALVNLGEFAAIGGPFRLGIQDPEQGLVTTRVLTDRAIATSSPSTLMLNGAQGHILSPKGDQPCWSTVSVEADSAAMADAASTAFCLMDRRAVQHTMRRLSESLRVVLVARDGKVLTLE